MQREYYSIRRDDSTTHMMLPREAAILKQSHTSIIHPSASKNKLNGKVTTAPTPTSTMIQRKKRDIPQFCMSDMNIELKIGSGSFSNVYRVRIKKDTNNSNTEDEESKATSSGKSIDIDDGTRYALKCLNLDKIRKDRLSTMFPASNKSSRSDGDDGEQDRADCPYEIQAAMDIVMEGDLLSKFDHENIIRLHGTVSADGCGTTPFSSSLSSIINNSKGYFLLQELLVDTLKDRFKRWKGKESIVKSLVVPNHTKSAMIDRVKDVAIGIARGMEYLQNHNIVFRDLVSYKNACIQYLDLCGSIYPH